MKSLARSHLWWPSLDKDIETWVATCSPCQTSRPDPPKTRPAEWPAPRGPWSRIHIDFAGPIRGQSFLIVVDAYSKWLEVVLMTSTTTEATIKALRKLFATHGLPDTLVSDNGPQLTARLMELFLADLGIQHLLAPAHFPQANGQAERWVRITKDALSRAPAEDWQKQLDEFLLIQHITPCSTTNKSPAELLMGRTIRTKLDRVHPHYQRDHETLAPQPKRAFKENDPVYARDYDSEIKWREGKIQNQVCAKTYNVILTDGRVWHRHIDQLRKRVISCELTFPSTGTQKEHLPDPSRDSSTGCLSPQEAGSFPFAPSPASSHLQNFGGANEPTCLADSPPQNDLRRSLRERKPPVRLQDYVTYVDDRSEN